MFIIAVFKASSPRSSFFLSSDFMDIGDLSGHHLGPAAAYTVRHNCPDCGKSYKWRHNMLQHRKRDCGKPPNFLCPYCEYGSRQKNNLTRHVLSQHKNHFATYFEDFHRKNTLGVTVEKSVVLDCVESPNPLAWPRLSIETLCNLLFVFNILYILWNKEFYNFNCFAR